jgi:hypothetical protein
MLRHKAAIQCARVAFGFAGIVEEDEWERMKDVTPVSASVQKIVDAEIKGASPHDALTGEIIDVFPEAQEQEADVLYSVRDLEGEELLSGVPAETACKVISGQLASLTGKDLETFRKHNAEAITALGLTLAA